MFKREILTKIVMLLKNHNIELKRNFHQTLKFWSKIEISWKNLIIERSRHFGERSKLQKKTIRNRNFKKKIKNRKFERNGHFVQKSKISKPKRKNSKIDISKDFFFKNRNFKTFFFSKIEISTKNFWSKIRIFFSFWSKLP